MPLGGYSIASKKTSSEALRESGTQKASSDGEEPAAGKEEIEPTLNAYPAVPVPKSGTLQQIVALARYMTKTEVHTYAFSVAAQTILSLFPFIVLLLTLAHQLFHSPKMVNMV